MTVARFARRELREECSLTADTLHKVGRIVFEFVGEPELMDVHVFRTDSVRGTPAESDGESRGLPFSLPSVSRGRRCASPSRQPRSSSLRIVTPGHGPRVELGACRAPHTTPPGSFSPKVSLAPS